MDAIPEPLRDLAQHPAPSPQHPAPGTRHSAPGTRHSAPSTRHSHPAPGTQHLAPALSRFVAAKAFASWTAYQAGGVRTLVAELVLAEALVGELAADRPLIEAIREADRLLVHLVDRPALVARLGLVEHAR